MKEEDTHDVFLLLVDQGFDRHRGFFCLNRIKGDFYRYFSDGEITQSGDYGLNSEFSGILQRAFDDFKTENTEFPDAKL
jgi:hypothetical protein